MTEDKTSEERRRKEGRGKKEGLLLQQVAGKMSANN